MVQLNTGATEEYDGTNWATSPGNPLNTARRYLAVLQVLKQQD
jgi:hypothetical protein